MASMLQQIARRTPDKIVKAATPEAWEATAKLREQYVATTLDALPARVTAASAEYASMRAKVVGRTVTVNEIAVGAARAVELYCCYLVGRVVGRRQLSP